MADDHCAANAGRCRRAAHPVHAKNADLRYFTRGGTPLGRSEFGAVVAARQVCKSRESFLGSIHF
jgi:hypothetical protein